MDDLLPDRDGTCDFCGAFGPVVVSRWPLSSAPLLLEDLTRANRHARCEECYRACVEDKDCIV